MAQGPREWEPAFNVRKRGVEEFRKADSIIITAPEWFEREDFQAWRTNPQVASWPGEHPSWQDTFTLFVDGELRDAGFFPPDIETTINRLIKDAGLEHRTVLIWIKAV